MGRHARAHPHPGPSARRCAAGDGLKFIKQSVAQRVIRGWKELDAAILRRITLPGRVRFWPRGGGFDRNVRDDDEFTRDIRYIHRNPVERGLVDQPEEWTWSSVQWWMGRSPSDQPCDPPPGSPGAWADWKGYV